MVGFVVSQVSGIHAGGNTSTIKVLAISFSYPPSALPRAVQVSRLLKYSKLPTVLVCAGYEEKDVRTDAILLENAESFLVECLRVPFMISPSRNLIGRVAYRFNLPVWDKIPDSYTPWRRSVLKAVDNFLLNSDYEPDVLVTFASPMSDHLIGVDLKRRLTLPWIAHFSDPWIDNPFAPSDAATKSINRRLERKVISAVDKVVFTSRETVDLVMSKYPDNWRAKAGVVPHAFEPKLFSGLAKDTEGVITIRYLGDFYGPRTPQPLFHALRHLSTSNPYVLKDVRFETIGTWGDLKLADFDLDSLPQNLVSLRPPVGYLESLSLMSSASGLLVIDAPAAQSVFLPSKLVDYIGSRQPIFGITPPGTASALIQKLGGWVADPQDVEHIANQLTDFLTFLRTKRGQEFADWGNPTVRSEFEAPSVAYTFAEMVREVVSIGR